MSKLNKFTEYMGITPTKNLQSAEQPVEKIKQDIEYDSIQTAVSLGAIACFSVVLEQITKASPGDAQGLKLATIGGGVLAIGNRVYDVAKRSKRTRKNLKEIKQLKAQNEAESSIEEI